MRNTLASSCSLLLVLALAGPAAATKAPHPAEGGANQRVSVEGCMNQWLFDGVWRVRVTDVASDGTSATLHVRNGTHDALSTADSGFAKINGQGIDMAFSDGTTQGLDIDGTQPTFRPQLSTKNLPPGGEASTKLLFAAPANASAHPAKLLIAVDPTYNTRVHYSVKDPSFRIRLDCTK